MPHYIDKYIGNRQVRPWWEGLPDTLGVAEYHDQDVASTILRERLFNYRLESAPACVQVGGKLHQSADEKMVFRRDISTVDGVDDSITPLRVVGKGFQFAQPSRLLGLGDAMSKTGEAVWHTAGILKKGRRVWGLAQVGEQFTVGREILQRFLLFWDAVDGSSRLLVKPVTTCVVCWNTSELALKEKTQPIIAIRHSGDLEWKLDEAERILREAEGTFIEQQAIIAELQARPMAKKEFAGFAAMILTGEDTVEKAMALYRDAEGRSKTLLDGKANRMLELWDDGAGAAERADTKWKAYNAVTEFIDHQHGRMGNYNATRTKLGLAGLESSWFGDGGRRKQRALQLLAA
jgi:phage/plasmid-like protein (TIGR03299 family)